MSLIATALKHMLAAGMAPDAIVAAVEAMEASLPQVQASNRSAETPGAERMRRYRERRRQNGLDPNFDGGRYVAALRERDGALCVYCAAVDGGVVDHMLPISQGGTDDLDNLALACGPCNCGKAGRVLSADGREIVAVTAREAYVRYVRERVRGVPDVGERVPRTGAQVVTPSLPSLRSEELEEKGSEPKGSSQKKTSGHFDQFWEAYPRKVGKAEARKAFDVAWRKLPAFDEMAVLIGGLERAKAGWVGRQRQYIPHADKWLRGEHWTDEPDTPEPERRRTLTAQIGEENDEAWRLTQRLLEAERNGDRHRDQGRIGSPQHALPSPADGNQPTGALVAGLVRGLGRVPH